MRTTILRVLAFIGRFADSTYEVRTQGIGAIMARRASDALYPGPGTVPSWDRGI